MVKVIIFNKIRSKKKKIANDDYVVGLDIGTEYIKALIAKIEGDKIEIVGVGRSRQGIGDMYAGAIADINSVVRNCEDALLEAESNC